MEPEQRKHGEHFVYKVFQGQGVTREPPESEEALHSSTLVMLMIKNSDELNG